MEDELRSVSVVSRRRASVIFLWQIVLCAHLGRLTGAKCTVGLRRRGCPARTAVHSYVHTCPYGLVALGLVGREGLNQAGPGWLADMDRVTLFGPLPALR